LVVIILELMPGIPKGIGLVGFASKCPITDYRLTGSGLTVIINYMSWSSGSRRW